MKSKHSRGITIPSNIEIQTTGRNLVNKIKWLVEQGNGHRLVVKKSDGGTLFETPVMPVILIGASMLLFAPLLVALGVVAGLVLQLEVIIESDPEPVYIPVETKETISEIKPKS